LVQIDEIDAALALLLGRDGRGADAGTVRDFAKLALARGITLRQIQLAMEGDRVIAAALPVLSPGRTALILTSTAGTSRPVARAIAQCAAAACQSLDPGKVRLAQFLLEPHEYRVAEALRGVDCTDLTTLIYLQKNLSKIPPEPTLPPDCQLLTYSPATHDLFSSAIEATYEQSLDCPVLHGKRTINDIVDGHKGAGEFVPSLWLCLTRRDQPLGVLLLAPVPGHTTMELVYTGLTVPARGQRLGDYLVDLALHQAAALGMDQLTLAVDDQNAPALRLYYRHGLGEVHRRLAMMRMI
jgi:ribosomal protein S18 acetylase RimI-like enzyme